jgi:hypothetical protein
MRNLAPIENIEEMRLREGIDDAELREQIRGLKVGDFVRLTMLTRAEASAGETLSVKITSIRRDAFRGELADSPAFASRLKLRLGSPVVFTVAHIHSLPKMRTTNEHRSAHPAPVTSNTTRAVRPPEKKAKPNGSATLKIIKFPAKKVRASPLPRLGRFRRGSGRSGDPRRGGANEKLRDLFARQKRAPCLQIMKDPTARPALSEAPLVK